MAILGNLVMKWYIFLRFGILYQGKSGNPALSAFSLFLIRACYSFSFYSLQEQNHAHSDGTRISGQSKTCEVTLRADLIFCVVAHDTNVCIYPFYNCVSDTVK
jgi:hypothetical protein